MFHWVPGIRGRFSPVIRFSDGSLVRWTSKESVSYERNGQIFDVQIGYWPQSGEYTYYLPKNLDDITKKDIDEKMIAYCNIKRRKIKIT
jgi:hypothetical protein